MAKGFVTTSQMKQRGWTEFLMGLLLGWPDDEAMGGNYPVRVYRRARVLAAERSKHFKADLKRRGVGERKTKQAAVARRVLYEAEQARAEMLAAGHVVQERAELARLLHGRRA